MVVSIQRNKRLDYIDVCRAIGIILVVLGHTYGIPYNLYLFIFSFHMPFFFILSGFVFNADKNQRMGFKQFATRKVRQYIIPYYIFGILNLVFEIIWKLIITKEVIDFSFLLFRIKGLILCTDDMSATGAPIWFLLCLFISSIIFFHIPRLRLKYQCITVLSLITIHYILIRFLGDYVTFIFGFPTFFISVFFMWIGYIFRMIFERKPLLFQGTKCIVISIALILISGFFVIITQNRVNLRSNTYNNYLVFLFVAVAISTGLICLVCNAKFLNTTFTCWLGKKTIYVIGCNYICLYICTEIYYLIPVIKNYPIHWITSFLFTLVLCFACIVICNKIKKLFQKKV